MVSAKTATANLARLIWASAVLLVTAMELPAVEWTRKWVKSVRNQVIEYPNEK